MVDQSRGYWDRHARRYDASMRLLGGPLDRAIDLTAAAVRDTDHVLEVAAGTGLFTTVLAVRARHVLATDYSAAMVEQLRARVAALNLSNVECRQADLYALGLEPSSFDVVVAANVLHLVPDLPAALTALERVLKPAGRLIAPTYCHDETWVSKQVSRLLSATGFPGRRRFTLASLSSVLSDAGFQPSRLELVPGILPIAYAEAVSRRP